MFPLLTGLIIYNWIAVIVLVQAFVFEHVRGIGLWPAVVVHTILVAWCIACLGCPNRAFATSP